MTFIDQFRTSENYLLYDLFDKTDSVHCQLAKAVRYGFTSACNLLLLKQVYDVRFFENCCDLSAADFQVDRLAKEITWPETRLPFDVLSKFHRGGKCKSALGLASSLMTTFDGLLLSARIKCYGTRHESIGVDGFQSVHQSFWESVNRKMSYLAVWPKVEIIVWRDLVLESIHDELKRVQVVSSPRKIDLAKIVKSKSRLTKQGRKILEFICTRQGTVSFVEIRSAIGSSAEDSSVKRYLENVKSAVSPKHAGFTIRTSEIEWTKFPMMD